MATQKPQPWILTFTKPDNIRGSVHGKISAYQELWNFVEVLRCENHNSEENIEHYKIKNDVITQVHSNIIKELKSLGCEVEDLEADE